MHAVTKNILKFTATGLVAGVVLGWLLSLPSGNYFVTLGVLRAGGGYVRFGFRGISPLDAQARCASTIFTQR